MSNIRRINFFSGPGCGKSTTSARLFSALKMKGHDVEQIHEYIKTWAHENRKPQSFDQLYVFAKQLKSEDVILRNVKHIVTDSPILMNAAYSAFYGFPATDHLIGLSAEFDKQFPSLNFFIDRTVDYVSKGRYQTYEDAINFDDHLLSFLDNHLSSPLVHVNVKSEEGFNEILSLVEGAIDDSNS